MSEAITSANTQIQAGKQSNPKFIIPALLVLPEIIHTIKINITNLITTDVSTMVGPTDMDIYTDGYSTYMSLSKLTSAAIMLFAVVSLFFFLGCILKMAGNKKQSLTKVYFAKEIVSGIVLLILQSLVTIFNYKWIGELQGPGYHASALPQIFVYAVMYLPIIICGALLLKSESTACNKLRKKTVVLMCVNIVFCLLSFVVTTLAMQSSPAGGILSPRPLLLILTSIGIMTYQLFSMEKKVQE